MKLTFVFYIILCFLLVGCLDSNIDPALIPIKGAEESISTAYPLPFILTEEGYPSLSTNPSEITPVQIDDPGINLASFGGRLYLDNGTLLPNTVLYITSGKGIDSDTPPAILIGPEKGKGDYVTRTDENSNFVFSDINPGTYFIVVSSSNSWSIVADKSSKVIPVKIAENEIKNLGNVYVNLP